MAVHPEITRGYKKVFIDYTNFNGSIARPTDAHSLRIIIANLSSHQNWSFSLIRERECDSGMGLKCTEGMISANGSEDSRERGCFGFVMIGEEKSSELIKIQDEEIPRYAITTNMDLAREIAYEFGVSGEPCRKVDWHVASSGLNRPLDQIQNDEILRAGSSDDLKTILRQIGALQST